MTERPAVASHLDLEPHPEGGWFRQTFKSEYRLRVQRGDSEVSRAAATMINFFLPAGEASAWHVVASTEIWMWQGPGTITLQLGGNGERPGELETYRLGPDFAAGDLAQLIIPPNVWQRTLAGEQDALASCMVSPGFEFEDFRLLT